MGNQIKIDARHPVWVERAYDVEIECSRLVGTKLGESVTDPNDPDGLIELVSPGVVRGMGRPYIYMRADGRKWMHNCWRCGSVDISGPQGGYLDYYAVRWPERLEMPEISHTATRCDCVVGGTRCRGFRRYDLMPGTQEWDHYDLINHRREGLFELQSLIRQGLKPTIALRGSLGGGYDVLGNLIALCQVIPWIKRQMAEHWNWNTLPKACPEEIRGTLVQWQEERP